MRVPAAQVHVAGVVPTLRAVFQQVDRAHRKCFALNDGVSTAWGEFGAVDKCKRFEWAAGSRRARTRQCVVDQVRALQMKTARAEITDFERRVSPETLLQREIPLLDVLRGRVRIERRKTHGGGWERAGAQHRSSKIEARIEQGGGRREVVGLLRLREHVRNVVPLIAPRVHIDRRKENTVGRMQHNSVLREIPRDANARRKIVLVRKKQTIWVAELPANESGRSAIRKDQIGIRVLRVVERASVLLAQTVVHGKVGRHPPTVLSKNRSAPRAEIHLRNARLPLFYGGTA